MKYMFEKIESMNFNKNIDKNEIYDILKSNSRKMNNEISQKIDSFSTTLDFLNYYSNNETKQLLNLINNTDFFSVNKKPNNYLTSLDSDVEKYISCLIKIIFAIKFFLKVQKFLNKILPPSRKCLERLKIEKKIENENHKNILNNLKSILNFSLSGKKINKVKLATAGSYSFISAKNIQNTNKIISGKNLFNKMQINNLISDKAIFNYPDKTPKFYNLDESDNEDITNKKTIQKTTITKSNSIKSLGSLISFKEMSFNNENNNGKNKNVSDNKLIKEKNNNYQENIIINKNRNNNKRNNSCYFQKDNIDQLQYLLAMINDLYRKTIINSEEKVKLKKLVIGKSKKVINFYHKFYKKANLNDEVILSEIKNIIYSD